LRLSFSYPTPESIKIGIRRLATVIQGETDLLETFAGTGILTLPDTSESVIAPPPDMN
jgi:hypothetical protein